ncbi:Dimodular nonribosomal peptide synthase [Sulfitobacter sp. THAF37]|uniref:MupA/Atu3671 family FMN-dependent luciferase-like monooxygenase n=1 Tax=Sulfitobacter sp. THAF37 TaxID=2587855 RepID=UPI0012683030|nr:MupA/Atu3671 family FMN-dependent luciferase-like monooxygenase [Sulfitobacter sp. THAF37]QFT60479.1 Dimodular nonribosomal peptide synthase [Sulfitobacter sp. THAF37]
MTATFQPAGFSAILIGDESLTIACGDMILAGGHGIAAVVTRDATVRGWAEGQGIATLAAPRDLLAADLSADWLLSIANLRMIPDAVLALPAKGAINFHDGPLPAYAGLNTPAWAIINGETTHGVSWHVIEGGVDEGDLLAQKMIDIAPDETAFTLNSKCYAAGMESFGAVLSQLEADRLERRPQDLSQRSYFARDQRPKGQGVLDLTRPAAELSALVRGLDFGEYWTPLCLPKLALEKAVAVIGGLEISTQTAAPGTVLALSHNAVTLGTATQAVRLSDLCGFDGTPVDLTQWLNVGDVVPTLPLAEVAVKDEAHWRGVLAGNQPLDLLLARSPSGPAEPASIALSTGDLEPDQIACVAALVALRSAGQAAATLAVEAGGESPLAAPWLPLAVRAEDDTPLATAADFIAKGMDRARASMGRAADLGLRDPQIDPGAMPDLGLSGNDALLPETAFTVSLSGTLHYDAARVSGEAARLIADRLNAALAALPDAATCGALWALPEGEVAQMLTDWNATDRAYDRTTVHAAFEAQAARTPDATALVFEDRTFTYAALNAAANRLAHVLVSEGAGPGVPIGLYCTRGPDLLIGTLAILKSGGAYVPLDPAYPADRIAHYITDSAAPLIVTQMKIAAQLPESAAKTVMVDADHSASPDHNPDARGTPDDLAYLIYTSGSTGTPKGVMVSHGNVANFFAGMDDRIDHDDHSVWLAVTSLSFDISVLELFWTISRGVKLVLTGDESRTLVSNGPLARSAQTIDFNIFYWGNDDGVGPAKYQLLLEGAKFADAHGFNAVWTPERHFHAFGGPYPNPSVTGAAVAAVTSNLAIRAGSCVAPLHHPARIAEEWAVIDNLTNGRVGLAIASGWQPDDFVLRPENTPPENKPAMYAAIDQLRQLWAGEAVEFPKKDGTPHAVITQPRPVSAKLPIWVTTAGNPQTWKEAGEIGANVLTHLLGQSVDEVADKIKIYHAALRDAGHDPADFTVTVMLHTYLAETREAAEEVAREPMKDYLRSAAGLIKQYAWAFPAFKKPEGATNPFDVNLEGLSDEEMDAILEFAFQRYFNDSGMFGTVADGLARTEQLKSIGVDEVACLIDYGIPVSDVLEGLKPLAQVLAEANRGTELAAEDFSIAAQIQRHGVTHLQCTPSMAQMLVTNDEAQQALEGVTHLMIGGEALPGTLVAALKSHTQASIQNMYGPTETTIWSTTQMVADAADVTAPIGTPIANTQVFILDDKMQPQPVGVAGELWIGGDGVTLGYWHREEMTADRFVDNPFGGGKIYRTGDVVSWDAAGCLHFAGRADAQVKIRGHRLELGEIEARLAALPGVNQAVVIAREGPAGAQLVGYVTPKNAVSEAAARDALTRDLPAIMVPSAIVGLDAMPLTPNKKIDRKALPAPTVRSPAPRPKPVPATLPDDTPARPSEETMYRIAQVWTGLLGVADIQADDNFFSLGGHSLLAVQAHRDIKAALDGVSLSITDIFRFPTLGALAGHIDKASGGALRKRQSAGDRTGRETPPELRQTAPALSPQTADIVQKRRAMRAARRKADA